MTAAAAFAVALGTAACAPEEQGQEIAEGMGNATPAPATAPASDLAGTVVPLGAEVTGALRVGDRILLRADDRVLSGTPAKPDANSESIDPACGLLAPSSGPGTALLPCPDGIHVLAGNGTITAVVGRGTAYSSAVGLPDGRIVGHRAEGTTVDVYGSDGEPAADFDVSRHGSQLIPVPGTPNSVMELNIPETSVHEVHVDEARVGSSLRAGRGAARAASGEDGTIVVTDATGDQLLVFTMTDIIRLHQMFPVPESPWAVIVDDDRDLVWVTSTAAGVLTGWDVSGGTGVKVAEIPLVADAQSLASDGDAGLVAYSATGGGAQHLDRATLDRAIDAQRAQTDADRQLMAPRPPSDKLPAGPEGTGAGAGPGSPIDGAEEQ